MVRSVRLLAVPILCSSLTFWARPDAARADDPDPPVIDVREVSIWGTRAERDVLDVPGNVTILDRAAIDRSGAKDLPDLLRREAGIFVTNTTGNPEGYRVEARGFHNGGGNGSGMLVLLNGRRLNETSTSVADWSFVHLDNVEQVEVIRGPASAVFGDNAEAGVIAITTRTGEGPLRAELRGRTGSYDTDAGSVFVGGSHGSLSAAFFADGFKTHGYRERGDFRARHGEVTLRKGLGEWGLVGVNAGYGGDLRQRPGSLDKPQMATNRRQAEPGSGDKNFNRARLRYFDGLIELYGPFESTLQLIPFWNRREDDADISDPFSTFLSQQETDAAGLNAQLRIDQPIGGHANRLILGVDALQEDTDRDSTFELFGPFGGVFDASTRSRRKLYGLFVQNEFQVTEDLLLSLGVRRERAKYRGRDRVSGLEFERRMTAWGPKAALTWRVAKPASVYASYSRGFRLPNINEAFGVFGFTPQLEPQKSHSYEIGGKWRSERVTANVALYTMNVQQEIFFVQTGPIGFGFNSNLDRVRHRGIEVQGSMRPLEWLEIYGSYTYDDVKIGRDKTFFLEGFRMPITPRHRGNAGVVVQLPGWTEVRLNANYVGARFLANDHTESAEKLPRFASYDAIVTVRPPLERLSSHVEASFFVAVRNLTNRRYTEFGGLDFNRMPGFFPSPDRHYEVGVTLRWK